MKNQFCLILSTAKDEQEAQKIIQNLLDEKWIACGNIVKDIQSLYFWQGKVQNDSEVLMILKTRQDLFQKISSKIKSLHSYDCPEIMALPVAAMNDDYQKWMMEVMIDE